MEKETRLSSKEVFANVQNTLAGLGVKSKDIQLDDKLVRIKDDGITVNFSIFENDNSIRKIIEVVKPNVEGLRGPEEIVIFNKNDMSELTFQVNRGKFSAYHVSNVALEGGYRSGGTPTYLTGDTITQVTDRVLPDLQALIEACVDRIKSEQTDTASDIVDNFKI